MKVRKRLLLGVLITSLLVLSVACSNESESETANKSKDGKMVWVGWSGEEETFKPIIQNMIQDWNKDNPDHNVEWVGWPWAEALQQMIIRTQGGENIDVGQIDIAWLQTLADTGKLVDLNTVFDEQWLKENIQESYLESGQIDGKQVGIPWTLASIGMVNNPSLLEKAGVTETPKTIEEFEKALKKLKESNPDVIPYALTTKDAGSVSGDFQAWLWTFGGEVFDEEGNVTINSPEGVQTLEWLKSLKDQGYIKMDMSRFDARELFAQNKVGFYDDAVLAKSILKSSGVSDDELNERIQPMLRPVLNEEDQPQSKLWGHMLVIFDNANNKEKAAEFIKHLISKEQSVRYFEEGGLLPVINSALESEAVQQDEFSKNWAEITKAGRPSNVQKFNQSSEIDTIITEEIQAALLDGKTAQEALDNAASRIESTLN
ncbi:ABC transporter substrate-binding protein [Novibacillus thermophilus]|uniref:ABC transporter substrate-binding protein n=1 Tax=Novibacillus thermophilus TaxID=1471761 RepID=UPI001E4FFA96|nr:sugar ABC transporter substrate-binding protein [Novibacillus thermophilus]